MWATMMKNLLIHGRCTVVSGSGCSYSMETQPTTSPDLNTYGNTGVQAIAALSQRLESCLVSVSRTHSERLWKHTTERTAYSGATGLPSKLDFSGCDAIPKLPLVTSFEPSWMRGSGKRCDMVLFDDLNNV